YTPTNGDDWNGFEDKNPLAADGCTTGQYDDRFVVVGSSNKTLDLVKYGSCGMEVPAVPGCMDENATNYDSAATIAAKDEYNNLLCAYTSCDDIPEWGGCIYSDSFGYYENGFNAENCADYGGTPCGELNLEEGNNKLSLIYPNPANNFITISDLDFTSVEIYNLTGQIVQVNKNSKVIEISTLPIGIYTLKITDINGDLFHSKLIKK
ncbi:T9SS type A sorting domain-containing protein, partial [Flavobacteriales bacterium]|nr:T9SS type A sorting domain-containing protein [Flavobacteriales bacterium]